MKAIRTRALRAAVKGRKLDVVRFLLEEYGGVVDVKGWDVGCSAREWGPKDTDAHGKAREERVEELLEVLVTKGWDVNAGEGEG